MAKKKTDPHPPDETELMKQPEETAADPPIEDAPENLEGENDLTTPDFYGNEEDAPGTETPSMNGEAGEGFDSLLQELGEQAMRQEEGADEPLTLPPLDDGDTSSDGYSPDDLLLLSEDNGNTPPSAAPDSSDIPTSPIMTQRSSRILTIDARDEVQTERDREATIWHEIQNSYRTRRIMTGTLDGIERTDSGLTLAVVNYKGFRIAIPLKEMMLYTERMPTGDEYIELMERLGRILNSRLGSEIDFIVKGYDNETRSVVASRRDAMLRKRQTFYMDTDELGEHMIYEGRVVQARVVAVAEKVVRVEAFGVECSIQAQGLSWEWIGNARDHFCVGDRVLIRIQSIDRQDVENISITADMRSVSSTTNLDNLKKIIPQARYAGRVTDVRNGVVYIRLNNGVNAIAHSCYDRRTPGKKDDVSFSVTRLNEEQGVAVGIITRIIKQNL